MCLVVLIVYIDLYINSNSIEGGTPSRLVGSYKTLSD